jgi:hypothetical protein
VKGAYETLLRLYTPEWRELFGREMARVFEEAAVDYRSRGAAARCGFLCYEFAGLISGIFGERWRVAARHWRRTRPTTFPIALTAIASLAAVALFQAPHLQRPAHDLADAVTEAPSLMSQFAELLVGSAIVVAVLTFFRACRFHRSISSSRRRDRALR